MKVKQWINSTKEVVILVIIIVRRLLILIEVNNETMSRQH